MTNVIADVTEEKSFLLTRFKGFQYHSSFILASQPEKIISMYRFPAESGVGNFDFRIDF